jgi:hypothetical protein
MLAGNSEFAALLCHHVVHWNFVVFNRSLCKADDLLSIFVERHDVEGCSSFVSLANRFVRAVNRIVDD